MVRSNTGMVSPRMLARQALVSRTMAVDWVPTGPTTTPSTSMAGLVVSRTSRSRVKTAPRPWIDPRSGWVGITT